MRRDVRTDVAARRLEESRLYLPWLRSGVDRANPYPATDVIAQHGNSGNTNEAYDAKMLHRTQSRGLSIPDGSNRLHVRRKRAATETSEH